MAFIVLPKGIPGDFCGDFQAPVSHGASSLAIPWHGSTMKVGEIPRRSHGHPTKAEVTVALSTWWDFPRVPWDFRRVSYSSFFCVPVEGFLFFFVSVVLQPTVKIQRQ